MWSMEFAILPSNAYSSYQGLNEVQNMISLNNVGNAGQALQYFSADNYYTQDEGLEHSEWFGVGAAALGLTGAIEKQDFFNVLAGKIEDQELGKYVKNEKTGEPERQHRPGIDITFSAPKSVSLLAEIGANKAVREAHEDAVKAALGFMEKELSNTRQMKDGELETVKTGNMIVGMFRHNTSRDLDPQTHTHAVIMNATRREDGAWRSLSNEEIYTSQRLVGAVYIGELAYRLQQQGYKVERTDDKGNFEIVGISREQIEHFSQRRAHIEAALDARGLSLASATAQEKEDATLATRARKKDVAHDELITEWKNRAQSVGIDLEGIASKAAADKERGEIVPADYLTGRQAMEFSAAHMIEREAVVPGNELRRTALEHASARSSPIAVLAAFNALESENHLIKLPDGNYTTAKMKGSEDWSLEQVRVQKGTTAQIMSVEALGARLDEKEQTQGFKFSEGQRGAIVAALSSTDRYVAAQGLSGTGKTTMLQGLREIAQEQGYKIRGMAPTGAASKVMAKETGIATDTVAMFMIKERQLQKDIEFAKQYSPEFSRKPELWLVDESSFLGQRQKAQLDYMAIKADAKIVYLGDKLQLQSIEAGKPFEMAQREGIETAHMTEISRQKTPELKQAIDIMVGRDQLKTGERLTNVELNNNARAFSYMDKAGFVIEVEKSKILGNLVGEVLDMSSNERERTLIITAFNKDRTVINDGIRSGLQEKGEISLKENKQEIFISKGWTRAKTREAQYYNVGDVVRFGRDYKAIDAQKGEYLRVVSRNAAAGVVVLLKENGSTIEWEPRRHNNVEAYSPDSRMLATGDLIRMTRNEGAFKNGEVARVVEVKGNVATVVVRGDEAGVKHEVDLAKSKHWDYAYSSTVYGSQGSTQHRVIFHIAAPDSDKKQDVESMAKVFGDRAFYVGGTRASHEMKIYTDDKALAMLAVTGKQDKTSVVEIERRGEIAQDKSLGISR